MTLAGCQIRQTIGLRRKRKLVQLRELSQKRVGEPRGAARSQLLERLHRLSDCGALGQSQVEQLVGAHPQRAENPWLDSRKLRGGELSHRAIERDLSAGRAVAQLGHESGIAGFEPRPLQLGIQRQAEKRTAVLDALENANGQSAGVHHSSWVINSIS